MKELPKIIVIVGPTATGKSDLAISLAKKFDGEVISADSRQVYRGLDIGSGKVTKREMRGIPHHLIDIVSPRRTYSVAQFQRDGTKAIQSILQRGKTPIIVGGTGFYVDALIYDMKLSDVKPNYALRKQLEKLTAEELANRLKSLDKRRYDEIDKHNRVRLVRAIEIASIYGKVSPITTRSLYSPLWIGLSAEKSVLAERIHARLLKRTKLGMLKEFETLHKQGLSFARMEKLGLEYRYGSRLLQKQITKKEFIDQLTQEIIKYSKRQMTWFKRNKAIHWLDAGETRNAVEIADTFLT